MTNFTLEKSVMRRVYLLWMGRLVLNRHTIKMALLALLAWQFAAYVFVRAVLENASHSSGVHYVTYFVNAFAHTQLATQAIIIGIILLSGWLALDAARNFRYARLEKSTV